jgi:hypothetical protein
MATPNRVGNPAPQLQNWGISFSPTNGAILKKEYRGVNLTQMTALANSYASTYRYSGELSFEGAIAKLTLSSTNSQGSLPGGYAFSGARDIIDKWEIVVAEESPDLFRNPNYLALFASADSAYASGTNMNNALSSQIAHLVRKIAGTDAAEWSGFWSNAQDTALTKLDGKPYTTGSDEISVSLAYIIYNLGLTTAVKYFVDDYFAGSTNYLHSKYSLRHTTSAPGDYGFNVTDFKVEKTYTISELLAEASDGSRWILPLPGYLNYKILNFEIPTLPPNHIWGAVKKRANAVTTHNNRIEISQEYIIDSCPKHVYPLAYP